MCIQLADGLVGDTVRQRLIKKYDIGTISIGNVLRLAFSSVAAEDIPELFESIYKACADTKP